MFPEYNIETIQQINELAQAICYDLYANSLTCEIIGSTIKLEADGIAFNVSLAEFEQCKTSTKRINLIVDGFRDKTKRVGVNKMITLRISKGIESNYDALAYLIKQMPVIINPIEDPTHSSTDTEIVKLIELDLPSDEFLAARKLLGFLGWSVTIVS